MLALKKQQYVSATFRGTCLSAMKDQSQPHMGFEGDSKQ